MIWDNYYAKYLSSLGNKEPIRPASTLDTLNFFSGVTTPSELNSILSSYDAATDKDIDWFAKALEDHKRKWFAASVVTLAIWKLNKAFPEALFNPMIRAAIYEQNPSLNRFFVECLSKLGKRRINESLLDFVEFGTNAEKAGAANALYWAQVDLTYEGNVPDFTKENATTESQALYDQFVDIRQRKRELFLKEFVKNLDGNVRRSIISGLNLDEKLYSEELKPLISEAIQIARTHPDEYIRHRIEVQLGQ